jgi:hypothetical protein
MINFKNRIKTLATKIAQNVERGSYFDSAYDTIGSPERSPMGGDYGGSPAQPYRPPTIYDDERLDRRKYHRFDVSLGVMSKNYAAESNDSVHFTSPTNTVSDAGGGVVTIL